MRTAHLFNSDHPMYGGYYGDPIRDKILGARTLQASGRHLKVRLGDVLIYGHCETRQQMQSLSEETFFHSKRRNLREEYLRGLFQTSTIYSWVIQNSTEELSEELHEKLYDDESYCGWHEVDLTFPKHVVLYINSMIPKYRIIGNNCNIFYSMGETDGLDQYEPDALKNLGFETVIFENTGAHSTIFDDYNTPDFFQRAAVLERILETTNAKTKEVAGEFALLLQDLNPGLLATLGAMAKAFETATNVEDLAQVAVSARRFIEQLADPLFEPSDAPYKGMSVKADQYKNRLLAYIDKIIPDSDDKKTKQWDQFRREIDECIDLTNKGLHAECTPDEIRDLVVGLTLLTVRILRLDLEQARNPYFGFKKNIDSFFREVVEDVE